MNILQRLKDQWYGIRIAEGEQLTTLGVGATFPASEQIAQFYEDNKGKPINVKPVRKLIEPNPDTFLAPQDIPEDAI